MAGKYIVKTDMFELELKSKAQALEVKNQLEKQGIESKATLVKELE